MSRTAGTSWQARMRLSGDQLCIIPRIERIGAAIRHLKEARDQLRLAGADKAADYVARALKSAEGAARHARCLEIRSQP